MSPTRTDDDLERLLRATLTTQARTVDYGPHWSAPADARHERRGRGVRRWHLAVAAALVLGLVATFVIVRSRQQQKPTPPAGLPASAFTSFDVPGYPITSRETMGDGSRVVIVRTPHGDAAGDVAVTLWAPHQYVFNRLDHQRAVSVSGHRGYSGSGASEQYRNRDRPLRSVVWEFASDQWAVAQQMLNLRHVPSTAAVLAVARATRPNQHLPLTTPFRLRALPAGYTLDQVEVQPSGVVQLLLQASGHRELELTFAPPGNGLSGGIVYRHGNSAVSIVAFRRAAHTTPADKAVARQAGRHIVWGTTDLSRIVP